MIGMGMVLVVVVSAGHGGFVGRKSWSDKTYDGHVIQGEGV